MIHKKGPERYRRIQGRLPDELEPKDNADERNENDNDRASHDTLLVHPGHIHLSESLRRDEEGEVRGVPANHFLQRP